MNTPEAQELKIYEVTHRSTGERHYAVSETAHDACSQAGWLIGDCYVKEQKPIRKHNKHEQAILLVKIPCQICPYQFTECNKPADAECPVRFETPDLNEWLRQTAKAHLCLHTGEDIGKRDYQKHLKRVSLQQAISELSAKPPTATPNTPEPACHSPLPTS